MIVTQSREDPTRSGHQLRPVLCIMRTPGAVCILPALPGKFRSAVNLIPVRRVIVLKLLDSPCDAHLLEHGKVRGCIGVVRIDECAVPVEENAFKGLLSFCGHRWTE